MQLTCCRQAKENEATEKKLVCTCSLPEYPQRLRLGRMEEGISTYVPHRGGKNSLPTLVIFPDLHWQKVRDGGPNPSIKPKHCHTTDIPPGIIITKLNTCS